MDISWSAALRPFCVMLHVDDNKGFKTEPIHYKFNDR